MGRSRYQFVRCLDGGAQNGAKLYRDTRSNGDLVVIKQFTDDEERGEEPPECQIYDQLPQNHEGIVKLLRKSRRETPDDCTTFTCVLRYYNGGSMRTLREYVSKHALRVPEAFLWSTISGVLEAFKACRGVRISHGDVHLGNITYHFDSPISKHFPRPVLIDLGPDGFETEDEDLRHDIARFFNCVYALMIAAPDQQSKPSYSQPLKEWIVLCAGLSAGGFMPPTIKDLMKNLYPRIPGYIQGCEGEKSLSECHWLLDYFTQLQEMDSSSGSDKRPEGVAAEGSRSSSVKTKVDEAKKLGDGQGDEKDQGDVANKLIPSLKRSRWSFSNIYAAAEEDSLPAIKDMRLTQPLSTCFGLVNPSPFEIVDLRGWHCSFCFADKLLETPPAPVDTDNSEKRTLPADLTSQPTAQLITALEEYYSITQSEREVGPDANRTMPEESERLLSIISKAIDELERIADNRKAGKGKDCDWLFMLRGTDAVTECVRRGLGIVADQELEQGGQELKRTKLSN
ncbi:hypothetical protein MMC10_002241 [Thelotrema lepadinum]|nr:hypothetical protein [Thelotrema lepadinum]